MPESRGGAHRWGSAIAPCVHDAGHDDRGQACVQLVIEGAQEAVRALPPEPLHSVPHPGLPQTRGAVPVWLPARRAVRGLDIRRHRQRTGGRVPEVPRLADGATRGVGHARAGSHSRTSHCGGSNRLCKSRAASRSLFDRGQLAPPAPDKHKLGQAAGGERGRTGAWPSSVLPGAVHRG